MVTYTLLTNNVKARDPVGSKNKIWHSYRELSILKISGSPQDSKTPPNLQSLEDFEPSYGNLKK